MAPHGGNKICKSPQCKENINISIRQKVEQRCFEEFSELIL